MNHIQDLGAGFVASMLTHHPENSGMVGIRGKMMNFENQLTFFLASALGHLSSRHGVLARGSSGIGEPVFV